MLIETTPPVEDNPFAPNPPGVSRLSTEASGTEDVLDFVRTSQARVARTRLAQQTLEHRVSFNGTDCRATFRVGTHFFEVADLTSLSLSSYRELPPVRTLGLSGPKQYAKGSRTIAGTLVLTVRQGHPLLGLLVSHPDDAASLIQTHVLPDQVPPFDILLFFESEHGKALIQTSSSEQEQPIPYGARMEIFALSLQSDSTVVSVDDQFTEVVLNYVALAYTPIRPDDGIDPEPFRLPFSESVYYHLKAASRIYRNAEFLHNSRGSGGPQFPSTEDPSGQVAPLSPPGYENNEGAGAIVEPPLNLSPYLPQLPGTTDIAQFPMDDVMLAGVETVQEKRQAVNEALATYGEESQEVEAAFADYTRVQQDLAAYVARNHGEGRIFTRDPDGIAEMPNFVSRGTYQMDGRIQGEDNDPTEFLYLSPDLAQPIFSQVQSRGANQIENQTVREALRQPVTRAGDRGLFDIPDDPTEPSRTPLNVPGAAVHLPGSSERLRLENSSPAQGSNQVPGGTTLPWQQQDQGQSQNTPEWTLGPIVTETLHYDEQGRDPLGNPVVHYEQHTTGWGWLTMPREEVHSGGGYRTDGDLYGW